MQTNALLAPFQYSHCWGVGEREGKKGRAGFGGVFFLVGVELATRFFMWQSQLLNTNTWSSWEFVQDQNTVPWKPGWCQWAQWAGVELHLYQGVVEGTGDPWIRTSLENAVVLFSTRSSWTFFISFNYWSAKTDMTTGSDLQEHY